MSNKTEATFHGPPPDDPWPAESLPQRVPEDVLTHWDDYWRGRAEFVRSAPPWVEARRRQPLTLPSLNAPVAPPPPPPTLPVVPPSLPRWASPVLAGVLAGLAFFAALAAILAVGLL